jgi:hypothetical protein
MNKNLSLAVFIILIFVGCKQNKKIVNLQYVSSDEAAITTLSFNATVPSDSLFKKNLLEEYPPELLFILKGSKAYTKKHKRELDTLRKELDTAKIYVFIDDTLVRMPKDYLRTEFKIAKDNNVFDRLYKGVNNWASEININDDAGMFYMKNLAFKYSYRYVLKSNAKPPSGKIFSAGTFRMSAIFFNSNKTKAFVYTEILYRKGYEIFFDKKNGKWFMAKKTMSWIS